MTSRCYASYADQTEPNPAVVAKEITPDNGLDIMSRRSSLLCTPVGGEG
jgi:hypothetical protein